MKTAPESLGLATGRGLALTPSRALHLYGWTLCGLLLALTPLAWVHPALGALRPWQIGLHVLLALALLPRREPLHASLQERVPRPLVATLAASALVWLVSAQLHRYWAFEVNGFDFSIFDWMLHNTWEGRFMYSPIYGVNHLGVHPSYVLFLLLPLHRWVDSPLLLCGTTAVVLWGGLWPLWRLAQRLLGSEPLGLLCLVAYVSNPWLGRLVDGGFRPEVLFPPVGLWLAWGWVERRPVHWVGALVLFLSIKEDAAFYTSALALGSLWLEPGRRRAAAGMLVASLGLLALNVGWVQPWLLAGWNAGQPGYVRFWGQHGGTLREILSNMVRAPWRPLWDVLTSGWYKLFGPALALPLLGRLAVPPMLPAVLLLGSAAYGQMHGYRNYYPVPLLPFVFWGLMEAWGRLGGSARWARWREPWVCTALLLFPLVGSGDVAIARPDLGLRAGLARVRERLEGWSGPVCTQSSLFPQLPYTLDLLPLTPECLEQPGSVAVLHPRLVPWPYTREQLEEWIAQAAAQGRAESLEAGFVVVRGR